MADENREDSSTTVGAVSRVATSLIKVLDPHFLALVVLNVMFWGVFFWFVDSRAKHTVEFVQQLLDECLKKHN